MEAPLLSVLPVSLLHCGKIKMPSRNVRHVLLVDLDICIWNAFRMRVHPIYKHRTHQVVWGMRLVVLLGTISAIVDVRKANKGGKKLLVQFFVFHNSDCTCVVGD